MDHDNRGNAYEDLNNIRITYVRAETRNENSNWSGSDVIRIQAYKGENRTGGLHRGAEMPVNGSGDLIDLAMRLLTMARDQIEE
jgi:hypothetical protein